MMTGWLTHQDCLAHDMGEAHPECPSRLQSIVRHLDDAGLSTRLTVIDVPRASHDSLLSVHSRQMVDSVFHHAPERGRTALDPDTLMNPYTLDAALRAAGAAMAAVDAVMQGRVRNAFCAIRPPGHHAEPDRAMGFCFFNNVALAARHALDHHGLRRVAVIDFDVHHGNGTQAALGQDDRVLMCGFFQHPLYPWSGVNGGPRMVNIPLPRGAGSADARAAVETHWLPALETFRPELILVSAGFDAHRDDPLGGLRLVEEDYGWITRQLCEVAERYCKGKLVSCLEGGYDLGALGRSVVAHVAALLD